MKAVVIWLQLLDQTMKFSLLKELNEARISASSFSCLETSGPACHRFMSTTFLSWHFWHNIYNFLFRLQGWFASKKINKSEFPLAFFAVCNGLQSNSTGIGKKNQITCGYVYVRGIDAVPLMVEYSPWFPSCNTANMVMWLWQRSHTVENNEL